MIPRSQPDPERVYTVSAITGQIRGILEESFPSVWVEGEISNYKHQRPSGHRYFSLKDENAALRCVMWRSTAARLKFEPESGQRVRAYGAITVYPPQGSYQLTVSRLVDIGIGPLEIAFQKLKEKLLKEGLFEEDRKQPLPEYPETVGVITSASGAAFVDITETIAQRHPGMRIILVPVRVQGEGAAEQITAGIGSCNQRRDIDVLIVGRGGGSLEDLWAFNEEMVARAIAASRIPVISAVGHEVDFTIADGVADYRAPTPTGAAERITDGWVRARHEYRPLITRLQRAMTAIPADFRRQLMSYQRSHALRRPADLLMLWSQRLDETTEHLIRTIRQDITNRRQALQIATGKFEALGPESVLRRGYSITRRAGDPRPLRTVSRLKPGETLETTLADGRIISEVAETSQTSPNDRTKRR